MSDVKSTSNGQPTLASVQANIARVAKNSQNKRPRDWMLYVFFRVMKQSEVDLTKSILKQLVASLSKPDIDDKAINDITTSLSNPSVHASDQSSVADEPYTLEEARRPAHSPIDFDDKTPDPAQEFFSWLKLVSQSDIRDLVASFQQLMAIIGPADAGSKKDAPSADPNKLLQTFLQAFGAADAKADVKKLAQQLGRNLPKLTSLEAILPVIAQVLKLIVANKDEPEKLKEIFDVVGSLSTTLSSHPKQLFAIVRAILTLATALLQQPMMVKMLLAALSKSPADVGRMAVGGRLPIMMIYEILRQAAPALAMALAAQEKAKAGDKVLATASPSLLRPEESEVDYINNTTSETERLIEPLPINLAFTHPGLKALKLDRRTLESFPDVFKQGMAARAERLGDTGPSAPENWDGELGLSSIHGYFSTGFPAGSDDKPIKESQWKTLRGDIVAFNQRTEGRGQQLRKLINGMFRFLGLEVVHIELGQDPYAIEKTQTDASDDGDTHQLPYRFEHFGFRDGISQPFIDMKLGTPVAGGGTPRKDGTWSPLAAGEVFLGQPDEDGAIHAQPFNSLLRTNSTFFIFRKLEQDVLGFRNYLRQMKPQKSDQEKLAAEMMGRWKNGTSLVKSPDQPFDSSGYSDSTLNDFLYSADDPDGAKCPLGAHARRANPRDIGNVDGVKRHRLLRRGIAYGGALLDDDAVISDEKRGLLFVAANARIDLQFEAIQNNWLNKGEFLGQAGLGKCPITGSNDGGTTDTFLESGAVAPINEIPRFVITRGGDYFFVPNVSAVQALANGDRFEPDPGEATFDNRSMGDSKTPVLFSPERIKSFTDRIINGDERSITVAVPQAPTTGDYPYDHAVNEPDRIDHPITFVGKHQDVCQVISGNRSDKATDFHFSVAHYRDTCRDSSGGMDFLVGTETGPVTGETRKRLQTIIEKAWTPFVKEADFNNRLQQVTARTLEATVARTRTAGRIDLVQDMAAETSYAIVSELFGVAGPDYLTELAFALPFSKMHIGQVHRDWLTTLKTKPPENPGMATLQLWSVLFLSNLMVNVKNQEELSKVAKVAGAEFMTHLDGVIDRARLKRPQKIRTLVDALVAQEQAILDEFGGTHYDRDAYYRDVSAVLFELVGTPMASVPAFWGKLIGTILDFRIDLTTLLPILSRAPNKGDSLSGIQRLIYETDRINPAFPLIMRHCEQDLYLESQLELKKDHWVGALAIAANFDPEVFPEPKQFSLAPYLTGPERQYGDYLMFGYQKGDRSCWGRDRLALYLLEEFIKSAGSLRGLRRLAGADGDAKTVAKITVGLKARFAKF